MSDTTNETENPADDAESKAPPIDIVRLRSRVYQVLTERGLKADPEQIVTAFLGIDENTPLLRLEAALAMGHIFLGAGIDADESDRLSGMLILEQMMPGDGQFEMPSAEPGTPDFMAGLRELASNSIANLIGKLIGERLFPEPAAPPEPTWKRAGFDTEAEYEVWERGPTMFEHILDQWLSDAATSAPETFVGVEGVQVTLKHGTSAAGVLKHGDKLGTFVIHGPAARPDGRGGGVIDPTKYVETVFLGSDVVQVSRVRDQERPVVQPVARPGNLWTPGQP